MSDQKNPVGTNTAGTGNDVLIDATQTTSLGDAQSSSNQTEPTTAETITREKKPTEAQEEALSRQEKLRRAKIAMEGFERTVKREATEKEEQASEEKQKIKQILSKVYHDKELLELTWVNLDDKRVSLKKLLEPLLLREEKMEGDEAQLESQEGMTFSPRDRRELEQKRWALQSDRRKLEEEKWVIEERILKIEEQIEENKKKYQLLLTEEDKLNKQLKDIDEQVLLQEEVLRQQRELQEETLRQEALKKAAEEKRQQEIEAARLAEEKKAEEEKKKREEELKAKIMKDQADQQKRFEALREEEEERQRQETAKRVETEQKAAELKKKIEEATLIAQQTPQPEGKFVPKEQIQTVASEQAPIPEPSAAQAITQRIAEEKEKQLGLKELQEIKKIRQENEEAIRAEREKQQTAGIVRTETLIDKLKEEGGLLKPLRTFKDDLAEAIKNQQTNKNQTDNQN